MSCKVYNKALMRTFFQQHLNLSTLAFYHLLQSHDISETEIGFEGFSFIINISVLLMADCKIECAHKIEKGKGKCSLITPFTDTPT